MVGGGRLEYRKGGRRGGREVSCTSHMAIYFGTFDDRGRSDVAAGNFPEDHRPVLPHMNLLRPTWAFNLLFRSWSARDLAGREPSTSSNGVESGTMATMNRLERFRRSTSKLVRHAAISRPLDPRYVSRSTCVILAAQ